MDISMDDRYAEICGISEKEIHTCFEEDIHELAAATGMSYEETCKELKTNYDGYHFTENAIGMYNPFSLLNTFAKKRFGSYWFETGTPTYLVELLKLHHFPIEDLEHIVTSQPVLDSIDTASTDPIPVIYQSGYLTIKGYNRMFENYTLGFPNREVEQGFFKFLLPNYASVSVSKSPYQIQCFVEEIMAGKVDDFFERLKTMFADIPYELARDREVHYQNILYIIFKLMGFYVQVEYHTNRGRIDLVLQTQDYVYIMEFKLNGSAEEALAQIRAKGYAEPFAKDKRTVYRIGVNFSDEIRNIQDIKIETTAAMLVLIGLLVLKFPKLIAGYNTMTPEQQKKVDIKRLKTFMCRAFCIMGIAILLVSLLLQPFTSDMIISLVSVLILVPGTIYMIIKAQRYDHN